MDLRKKSHTAVLVNTVKDVNLPLAYDQRKSAPMMSKNNEYDAYSVATVLINQLKLPDAKPKDNHWTLCQLVNRRDILVKDGIRLKNGIHEQISIAYPGYHQFFSEIDGKTALYFWEIYPSPIHLAGKSIDDLTEEFRDISRGTRSSKAEFILECVKNDGSNFREYQESRDFLTRSIVWDLEHQKFELAQVEQEMENMLLTFDYQLMTMPGIGVAVAS